TCGLRQLKRQEGQSQNNFLFSSGASQKIAMLPIIVLIILFIGLVMMIIMTYNIHTHHKTMVEEKQEKISLIQGWLYAGITATILGMIAAVYFLVKGTVLEGHLMEWLNLVVRVMHFTFGIAWIGASFYFVFL